MRHVEKSQGRYASRRRLRLEALRRLGEMRCAPYHWWEEERRTENREGVAFGSALLQAFPTSVIAAPKPAWETPHVLHTPFIHKQYRVWSNNSYTKFIFGIWGRAEHQERRGYHALARPDLAQLFTESYSFLFLLLAVCTDTPDPALHRTRHGCLQIFQSLGPYRTINLSCTHLPIVRSFWSYSEPWNRIRMPSCLAVPAHGCVVMSFALKQFIEGLLPCDFLVRNSDVRLHSIN